MGKSNVEKLARLLKGLVLAVFICNLIALFFVPCVVLLSPLGLFQQLAGPDLAPAADPPLWRG